MATSVVGGSAAFRADELRRLIESSPHVRNLGIAWAADYYRADPHHSGFGVMIAYSRPFPGSPLRDPKPAIVI
jgi:hypothetical protein